ncbi:MAG: hypothetical protein ACPGXY_02555 [Alphaproteobacteria bacterium]
MRIINKFALRLVGVICAGSLQAGFNVEEIPESGRISLTEKQSLGGCDTMSPSDHDGFSGKITIGNSSFRVGNINTMAQGAMCGFEKERTNLLKNIVSEHENFTDDRHKVISKKCADVDLLFTQEFKSGRKDPAEFAAKFSKIHQETGNSALLYKKVDNNFFGNAVFWNPLKFNVEAVEAVGKALPLDNVASNSFNRHTSEQNTQKGRYLFVKVTDLGTEETFYVLNVHLLWIRDVKMYDPTVTGEAREEVINAVTARRAKMASALLEIIQNEAYGGKIAILGDFNDDLSKVLEGSPEVESVKAYVLKDSAVNVSMPNNKDTTDGIIVGANVKISFEAANADANVNATSE